MKQIISSHENQIRQQVPNFNHWARIKEPEPQREEDIVWLTPDEFKKEVCHLLKERFDEWERRKVQ